jgi:hypothetical protein
MQMFTRLLSTTVLTLVALACIPGSAQQATSSSPRGTRRVIEHRGWSKARDYQDLEPQAQLMYISG